MDIPPHLKELVSGDESELKTTLKATEYNLCLQEALLYHIPQNKTTSFKCVLNWGGSQKDMKIVWELVRLLLRKDKEQQSLLVVNDVQIHGIHAEAHHDRQSHILLGRVAKAKMTDLLRFPGPSGGNILHATCLWSTSRALETIITEISTKKGSSVVTTLAEKSKPVIQDDNKHYTPLEVALRHNSVDMVKILAGYEDGMRGTHLYMAAAEGNLGNLQALVDGAGKEVTDSILTPRVLHAAIDKHATRPHRRYFEIWNFIISNKKELGEEPGLLKLAIENGHLEIVKSLLDNYKSHLTTSLESVSEAAQVSIRLISKRIDAKKDWEDRLAQRQTSTVVRKKTSTKQLSNLRESALTKMSENQDEEVQAWETVAADGDELTEDGTDDSTSSDEGFDEEQDDQMDKKLAEMEKTIMESTAIRDVLMDRMVRTLAPRDIKTCWPREQDKPVREVCLELNVTSGQDWTWFVQFVQTAKAEVDKIEIEMKKAQDSGVQAAQDTDRHSDNLGPEDETIPAAQPPETFTDVQNPPEGNEDVADSKFAALPVESIPIPNIESSYRPEFQPYLKFVSFPDLDLIRGHRCAEPIRDIFGLEVLYVVKWLQMVKGVKKVMKLKVLDSRYEPHREEVIEDCIKRVDVEELDWRRTDLSIETVQLASPKIQKLYLYSSGDWTPLLHWMDAEGLNRLEHANKINVTIINDRVSETRTKAQKKRLSTWSDTHWIHRQLRSNGSVNATRPFEVTARAWGDVGPTENPTKTSTRFARTVVQLEDFVSTYRAVRRKKVERATRVQSAKVPKPVKVAIIDTGINQNSFDPKKYKELNCKGDMFSETQDSHWWLSADSHGTQMAKLVTAIDPHCELFIAKVGDHKTDITRGAVTKAILGAIAEDVDVISMSFALERGDSKSMSDLEQAVQHAARLGIVMVCSTADEGENKPEAWPAKYKETISIAACGSTGKPVDESNTTDVNFFFQGEDILHENFTAPTNSALPNSTPSVTISGGNDHHNNLTGPGSFERISGSSVATAIAAGVASLFLACCRLDGLAIDQIRRSRRVRMIFKTMTGTTSVQQSTKYVRPSLVFENKGRGGNTTLLDAFKFHHLIVPK